MYIYIRRRKRRRTKSARECRCSIGWEIAVRIATPISCRTRWCNELLRDGSHCLTSLVSDLRFANRITNRNCDQIARFGALRSCDVIISGIFLGISWPTKIACVLLMRLPRGLLEADLGGHFSWKSEEMALSSNPPSRSPSPIVVLQSNAFYKLLLMILHPQEHSSEKWVILTKKGFVWPTMHFPTESATSSSKTRFFQGHSAGHCRKVQECCRLEN